MPGCIQWGVDRHKGCVRYEDKGYSECKKSEDKGYNDCCKWIPCSWFCSAFVWISNVVCVVVNFISMVVCIIYDWVTTAVCVLWDVVTTIVNAVIVPLEALFGWVFSAIAFLAELVNAIPVLGAAIRWFVNTLTSVFWTYNGLVDTALGVVGIRPEKIIRICTVILSDEEGNPVASVDNVVSMLQLAANVYKRDANVRLVPLRPLHFATGFGGAETVNGSWVLTDSSRSKSNILDAPCSAAGEWLLEGSILQLKNSTLCLFGAWRRVLGYGAPITCFVVRSMPAASGISAAGGCSLVLTDYVGVVGDFELPPRGPSNIGHEVGHTCLLWHTCVDDNVRNIMAARAACTPTSGLTPDRVDPVLADWQAIIVRSSKHATYF